MSWHPRVAGLLAALPPTPLAAALRQLEFAPDLDAQLELISAAWLLYAEGATAADEISRQLRDKMMRDGRDLRRAGRAEDAGELAELADPVSQLEAEQAARAWRPGAATLGGSAVQALPVAAAAARCLRGLRSIQTRMRGRCLAEEAGQQQLAGVPPAAAVYSGRRRGGAA